MTAAPPARPDPAILRRLREAEAIARVARVRTLVATLRLATYYARRGDFTNCAPLLVEAATLNVQAANYRRAR